MSATSTTIAIPYRHTARQVMEGLRVKAATGLSSTQVSTRQKAHGLNELQQHREHLLLRLLADHFKSPLVLLLLAAVVLSLLQHERSDALIIAVALVLDLILSLAHVWRTEKTLLHLRAQVELLATVVRSGRTQQLPAKWLVPGDIIELHAGQQVPADARVLRARALQLREALLTGESAEVTKTSAKLATRTPLGNQVNMVFMGTTVTAGDGLAVVTQTGNGTELGKIAQLLQAEHAPLGPLQRSLRKTGWMIGVVAVITVTLVGVINFLQGATIYEALRTAITLIVSIIPEDLTVILTIVLTIGVSRILRVRGVVRGLGSAETLGATTVICTDKTGTLTEGKMTVEGFDTLQGVHIALGGKITNEWQQLALTGLALNTEAHRVAPETAEYIGNGLERGMLSFVEQLGFLQHRLRRAWRQRDALHFSSAWKYKAVLCNHPTAAEQVIFVSGAPEIVLARSSHGVDGAGHRYRLTHQKRQAILTQLHSYATAGERLVSAAVRRHAPSSEITHKDIHELTFIGVLRVTDPIRPEVQDSLRATLAAGVAVKIVTGDYAPTAQAVARKVGLTIPADAIITGDELANLSDKEVTAILDRTLLFARVTPTDKQRLVRLLQAQGHVVAMTGDGVNDAVALKAADIGIGMGSGTDIAKDAADLILLDDSFATIPGAIAEGRVIRDNMRKVLSFLLSTNVAEVAIFLVSVLFKLPLPLLPAQILWINIVTDGTSDLALALEPAEKGILQRRPEATDAPLFSRRLSYQTLLAGGIITIIGSGLYWYLYQTMALDLPYARTMVFTFIALTSILSTWSYRSLHTSILRRGFYGNPWVPLSVLASLFLQFLALYLPGLQRFFGTVPLDAYDWALLIVLSSFAVLLIECRKLLGKSGPDSTTILAPTQATRREAHLKTLLPTPVA